MEETACEDLGVGVDEETILRWIIKKYGGKS